ncbi:MAG: hypothetical protein EOP88_10800 [Verrucomicrobiaceae bacterium]|nr:MAG: hypothetical protein EOP88_10800 [Verrucomicrobiaceae bacterium]
MNARPFLTAIAILGAPLAIAQNVSTGEPQVDPVLDAIQKFNELDKKENSNEVTVVLDAEGESVAPAPAKEESKPESAPAETTPPVLVTGKPPEAAQPAPVPVPAAEPAQAAVAPEESSKAQDGLSVSVEKLQTGTGSIDPTQVKLLAPFPAKPLAAAPAGWHLDASDSAPPFTREVEISPGTKVTLTIRPHLLVPDADGTDVFAIPEPGYDTTLGYQQTATVGAILSNSIRQLDEDSKRLGNAIDNLQQLLVSLPKLAEEPKPEAKPATLHKR